MKQQSAHPAARSNRAAFTLAQTESGVLFRGALFTPTTKVITVFQRKQLLISCSCPAAFLALETLVQPHPRVTLSWWLNPQTLTIKIQPCTGRGESCLRLPQWVFTTITCVIDVLIVPCFHISFVFFQPSFLPVKPDPPPVCPVTIPVSESTHFRVITQESSSQQCPPCSDVSSSLRLLMQEESAQQTVLTVGMASESMSVETQTGVATETLVTSNGGAAARMVSDMEETTTYLPGKTDSPSKKKGRYFLLFLTLVMRFLTSWRVI